MKKIINYLLILVLCITLVGCNNRNNELIDEEIEQNKVEEKDETIEELLTPEYKDVVSEITGKKEDKIVLYLFYGQECPHCEDERAFLEEIKDKYKDYLIIKEYETWHNAENDKLMSQVKEKFEYNGRGVPFTVIGETYYSGYSDSIGLKIENTIREYIKKKYPSVIKDDELIVDKNTETIPFLGKINVKNTSITTIAIILGFIDGFNPCAMWILIFLIGMLFNMENKKRMWLIGYTFLLTSSIFYFFAIFFLDIFLSALTTTIIRYLIGLVAIIGGSYNLYKYFNEPKDGCSVTTSSQRKEIMEKVKKFTTEKNLFIALFGVISLAISVNLIEIMCTTGFPTLFLSILEINNITGISKIIYLIIYIIVYMLDDFVVFIISMITLEVTGISTKYNKLSHLIGGILMVLMGILLIFKYNWLMFNF